MITPEEGVAEGLWNPFSRMLALFVASYFAGAFHPLPETIYHLIIGPQTSSGGVTVTHTAQYIDWSAVPFIGTLLLSTGFLSFPLFFFCIMCSVLDRWEVRETIVLGAAVSFSLFFADDVTSSDEWLSEVLIFIASTVVFFVFVLWSLSRLAEQDITPNR